MSGIGGVTFVDLHTHSTASDGSLPPEEVVRRARRSNLSAIALTDHDTVDGVAAAQAEGARLGVRVVPGTELSAYNGDREVHILALHLQRLDVIAGRLAEFREARKARAERMVGQLRNIGIPISVEDVLAQSGGGAIGRPHVARALVAAGVVADQREAFDRYIAAGRPGYVAKPKLSIGEAVEIAHGGGGIAIWAHPGCDGTLENIRTVRDNGMDGVEVRHPSHTPQDIERIGAIVNEFKMLRSGGSDWHGATNGARVLGNMNVPKLWLDEQDAHVAA